MSNEDIKTTELQSYIWQISRAESRDAYDEPGWDLVVAPVGAKQARELVNNGLQDITLLATTNPVKTSIYNIHGYTDSANFWNLKNLQNANTWIQRVYQFPLPKMVEPEEPFDNARDNAVNKSVGYLLQCIDTYKGLTTPPGKLISIDDDFIILSKDEGISEFQPAGAIKKVGEERSRTALEVAEKYSQAVDIYGIERDLRHLGLSEQERSLPVLFTYCLSAAVFNPESRSYQIYISSSEVLGYLLENRPERYDGRYPVVWIPESANDRPLNMNGLCMGNAIAEMLDNRNRVYVDSIFMRPQQRIQEIINNDTRLWEDMVLEF